MDNKKKKNIVIYSVIVCTLILVGFLGSYAYFINTFKVKNQEASVETGKLSLIFEDGNAGINEALNFGSSITKTFTIENNGSLDATAVMYFDNLVNTYTLGSLTYTLSYSETEDGEYQKLIENSNVPRSEENTSRVLSNNISIPTKKKYYYKLTITLNYLSDVDQTQDLNAIFSTTFSLQESENVALETLLSMGLKAKEITPSFSKIATTDETKDGLYSMEDDYGTTYFFRGATTNNYVKFAGFWWRIIRINGDGSVRIIYDGQTGYKNGTASDERDAIYGKYNTSTNDAKYVGYMYGNYSNSKKAAETNRNNSEIKEYLDEWYKINIEDRGYSEYISDTLFCNDRSTAPEAYIWADWDTAKGYGKNFTLYASTHRHLNYNNEDALKSPNTTFKCAQKNDRFTKNSDIGNKALTYPIGTLTADEAIAAGGSPSSSNTKFYLYKGHEIWTMTPANYNHTNYSDPALIWSDGIVGFGYGSQHSYGISPVINIKPEVASAFDGTGTITDPFRIKEFNAVEAVKAILNNKKPASVKEQTPDFTTTATLDEGVFSMPDDYGTSYYYRGAVENNYVKFAGFYWRIIRINGDGSLRIIYDGTRAYSNGTSNTYRSAIRNVKFNTKNDDAKYVGYMYGGDNGSASTSKEQAQTNTTNSNAKIKLDEWYKVNIEESGYSSYVADSIFCNDRSTNRNWWESSSSTPGYGTNITPYGLFSRFNKKDGSPKTTVYPVLTCPQKNDAFTVNDTEKGNGKLTYPIGLITGDEIFLGGATIETPNTSFYLYKGHSYWSMTPLYLWTSEVAYATMIGTEGSLEDGDASIGSLNRSYLGVGYSIALSPVINLKADTVKTLKGTGTMQDPFTLPEN